MYFFGYFTEGSHTDTDRYHPFLVMDQGDLKDSLRIYPGPNSKTIILCVHLLSENVVELQETRLQLFLIITGGVSFWDV